jgi:hypothetical protein
MKIIGIPGEVSTAAAPRVARFFEYQPVGSLGEIMDGIRCAPFESAS